MKDIPLIEIILATYNGSQYLKLLLDSLVSQTYKNFAIITYDDDSKDNSKEIVDSYKSKLPIERIYSEKAGNIGAQRGFELLLKHCSAQYIMFCDQDDIWKADKLQTCINFIQNSILPQGDVPFLLFTDMEIIDMNGSETSDSFNKIRDFNFALINDYYYLTLKNPAAGCSMVINQKLLKISIPIGKNALMHDWWMILCAQLSGRIFYLKDKTVKYRIHSNNTVGVKKDKEVSLLRLFKLLYSFKNVIILLKNHVKRIKQGKEVSSLFCKEYSAISYFVKLIVYRYVFKFGSHLFPTLKKQLWK